MKLIDFGFNDELEKLRNQADYRDFEVGRITSEHKERYTVFSEKGEFEAEITGNLRFSASGREDFPAVGDWVALTILDSDFAIIHKIFPRNSVISRQAVGQSVEIQIIAANIDFALLMQAVDRDFNINRLERYLTICYSSKVDPIIVLTKTDLSSEERINEIIDGIKHRVKDVPVIAISNENQNGYEDLKKWIEKGKTYCILGSSGVGKSTLLNNLTGRQVMKTGSISESSSKGRHVTSHRELIVLDGGGILIDNPGMREVGIADSPGGLEKTFNMIAELSKSCKYSDCSHTSENGCAVLKALETGELDLFSYENYLKMQKERNDSETSIAERRKKEKIFGKIIKDYNKKNFKK